MNNQWLITVILLLIGTPHLIEAQTGQKVGINLTPTYSYYHATTSGDGANDYTGAFDEVDEPRLGYSAGFTYARNLSSKITLQGGIQFTDRGFRNVDNSGSFAGQINTQYGSVYDGANNSAIKLVTIVHHYYYLDIPVRFQYNFTNRDWHFYSFAGLSPNVFLGHNRRAVKELQTGEQEVSHTSKTEANIRPVNLQAFAGAGVGYHLNDKFEITAEPLYRLSLNSFNNNPNKYYFRSVGLQVGGSYRF